MTQVGHENVWKLIKEARKSLFLSKNKQMDCDVYKVLFVDNLIKFNIDSLAEKLELNPTSIPNENVSHITLETAGEMFTYLNYCPNKLESIIVQILENGTPKDILLAFSSILNSSPKNSIKRSSRNILLKVLKSLELDTYEKIQILTKGKCFYNDTFSNCKSMMSFTDEDIRKLGLFLL